MDCDAVAAARGLHGRLAESETHLVNRGNYLDFLTS
jgi:hypothetical protein